MALVNNWQIEVVLEPDQQVAEVSYRGEQFAALIDGDRLEVYPRSAPGRESDKWSLDPGEVVAALQEAAERVRKPN